MNTVIVSSRVSIARGCRALVCVRVIFVFLGVVTFVGFYPESRGEAARGC
jgi:hypothetical protein